MKEKDIQKQILDWLRYHGIFCWKNNTAGIYKQATGTYIPCGLKGVSDILGILPCGKFLAIEVKMPKKKPNKNQWEFIKNINRNDGVAFYADNLEVVEINLKGFIKS